MFMTVHGQQQQRAVQSAALRPATSENRFLPPLPGAPAAAGAATACLLERNDCLRSTAGDRMTTCRVMSLSLILIELYNGGKCLKFLKCKVDRAKGLTER